MTRFRDVKRKPYLPELKESTRSAAASHSQPEQISQHILNI